MKIKRSDIEEFEKLSKEDRERVYSEIRKRVYSEIMAGISLSILIFGGTLFGIFELLKYLFGFLNS